jgi:insulysin
MDPNLPIEVSQQDDRKYKLIQLSNKLTCLLISDSTTDKAAAAMDVRVGHLSDPSNTPGLAHFLEHMLFMGTDKYPDENDYNVFLSSHGGSSNAFTDMESTNYYFDVSSNHFEGALDRFAQFFINPLFSKDSTDRELNAVDSEHAKNLQNDSWRMFQLSKSLCKKEHPFSKFGSGNLVTLKEGPEKEGLDIRALLLDFHERYYSANVMKLVLLGKESLEELEALAQKYLTNVPNQDIDVPHFPGTPFGKEELCKKLMIVPVKDGMRSLEMQFPMREIDSLYLYKPTRYLSHLIGHEGKGSILELLKEKGWANELSSGESRSCSDWSAFSISVDLTDEGLEKVDQVVEVIFAYIALVKKEGIQQWIHDETATVAACQFRFLSKRNPMDYTCSLASAMHLYPGHHVLAGPYNIYDYDPEMIGEFLNYFTPENMLLSVASKTFEGSTELKEHWYGTEYSIEYLNQDTCDTWSKACIDSDVTDGLLKLPEMNDMIASDFGLKGIKDMPVDEPKLIMDTDLCRLWYKPDNVFDMPKVNIMCLLRTAATGSNSAVESVLSLLYSQIMQEHTNDFTYLASMASLHSSVANSTNGIELSVSGYNHKSHILLKRLVQAMTELPDKLELALFDRMKDKVSKQYQNFLFAQPYQHAIYATDLCLESTKWSIDDKMSALKSIEMRDVIDFASRLLSRFHVELLVHGNVSADEAKDIADIVLNQFKPSPPFASTIPQKRVAQLQDGKDYVHRSEGLNEKNTNSSIVSLYQVGPMELHANAVLALFHHLLKEPAFNELRTSEQLGYIVHTSIKTSGDNIKGLLFLIQSDSFDPIYMDGRIEAFIERLREKITDMTDEEFKSNIDAVCQSFREKNKNIGEESSQYWNVLTNNTYMFKRLHLIADEVEKIEKEEVLDFYDEFVKKGASSRRKVGVQVFAKQHMEKFAEEVAEGEILIDSASEFKRTTPLFGLPPAVDLECFKL